MPHPQAGCVHEVLVVAVGQLRRHVRGGLPHLGAQRGDEAALPRPAAVGVAVVEVVVPAVQQADAGDAAGLRRDEAGVPDAVPEGVPVRGLRYGHGGGMCCENRHPETWG